MQIKDSSLVPSSDALQQVLDICASELPSLTLRLAGVIRDREEEFLHLGATIFASNSKARTFSSNASDIAQSVGQRALEDTVLELQEQITETRSVFAVDASSTHLQDIESISDHIGKLTQAMSQFGIMVRSLKILEIATRIESAHLGQAGAGFSTLADDVKSLSTKIVQNSTTIREHIDTLYKQVGTTHQHGKKQMQEQNKQVQDIFAKLQSGIEQMQQMRASTEVLIEELAQGSSHVAKNMGQVVASVQFHDITRQQVEHVQKILDQVAQEISQGTDHGDSASMGAWTLDVLKLQISQLKQTKIIFSRAMEDLIASLNSIVRNIDELCQRIAAVVYVGTGQQASTLDLIGEHIAQVIQTMRLASDQALATSQTMTNMAGTISTVGEFVDDIDEIGTEIELIALNASVKAAHTGDQGRALGVLAIEIQDLSNQSQTHTSRVTDTLNRIADIAQSMILAAQQSDMVEKTTEIQHTFNGILERLNALDQSLRRDITTLLDLGKTLVQDMRGLTDSIQVHHEVEKDLSAHEEFLSELMNKFAPFSEILQSARQPEKLREQLDRYTMESERLVHLDVFGQENHDDANDALLFEDDTVELFDTNTEFFDNTLAASDQASTTPNGNSQAKEHDDDLGDNVELF